MNFRWHWESSKRLFPDKLDAPVICFIFYSPVEAMVYALALLQILYFF